MSCRTMWTDAKKIDQPSVPPITRQTSIFSLTFDEIQSTMGGIGNGVKDFGSMNMEEFLKNLWTAEEGETVEATVCSPHPGAGTLQRQGSLTLPRTLSQKTVDDVWQELMCDNGENTGGRFDLQQQPRQPSLGEMTLEEFLVRAGVVKEEMNQTVSRPVVNTSSNTNSGVYYGDMSASGNSNGAFSISFSQVDQSNVTAIPKSLPGNSGTNLSMFSPGVIGPYAAQLPLVSQQGMGGGAVGIVEQVTNTGAIPGTVGLGVGAAGVLPLASQPVNQITYEGFATGNDGEMRGRKSNGAVEKVVERRQRRMIKNRESAARSRARKQAYTMELEAEIAKLKEENQDLQMKQVQQLEKQKKQGFRKVVPDRWEFANDNFRRGDPTLLSEIRRRKGLPSTAPPPPAIPSNLHPPPMYSTSHSAEVLSSSTTSSPPPPPRLRLLSTENKELRRANQALSEELENAKRRYDQLLCFLSNYVGVRRLDAVCLTHGVDGKENAPDGEESDGEEDDGEKSQASMKLFGVLMKESRVGGRKRKKRRSDGGGGMTRG